LSAPVFYLLAGPNGAGKSTLYRSAVAEHLIPAQAEFVNADLYEAKALQHVLDPLERSRRARLWADARRAQCLVEARSFVSETVFSHPSKLDLIAAAQRSGFGVVLLVVCVDNPQQLLARVDQRVQEGVLYDTSQPSQAVFQPPRLVARLRRGALAWQSGDVPVWAQRMLCLVSD
jgi:predicted ABC-type ATPase